MKKDEIEQHKAFVKLIQSQRPQTTFEKGMDAIHWWNTKNKWKRDLKADEAKALRMIISYLNRQSKENAEPNI